MTHKFESTRSPPRGKTGHPLCPPSYRISPHPSLKVLTSIQILKSGMFDLFYPGQGAEVQHTLEFDIWSPFPHPANLWVQQAASLLENDLVQGRRLQITHCVAMTDKMRKRGMHYAVHSHRPKCLIYLLIIYYSKPPMTLGGAEGKDGRNSKK